MDEEKRCDVCGKDISEDDRGVVRVYPDAAGNYEKIDYFCAEQSDSPSPVTEALHRHVAPDATVVRIDSTPIDAGMSGAEILRNRVTFRSTGADERTVSLITKKATLIERRVLALLQDQGQTAIPFNYSADLTEDRPAYIWMEDLGDLHRPTSLEPIPPELIQREAEALARIHHANTGRAVGLAWLPSVDRRYVHDHLSRFWEPAWERVVADSAFRREFGSYITVVEAAAAHVADELERVSARELTISLVHGDINPSNVLITDGKPRFIDWQTACYGPLYLDLPHHLSSPAQAEEYRRARLALGDSIPPAEFEAGFRAAAHYIGMRYMWWALEMWETDPTETEWVRYYLDLVIL